MKNPRLTRWLIPIVIGIWALVLWRFFGPAESAPVMESIRTSSDTVDLSKIRVDSFTLYKDYRDPFLDKAYTKKRKPALFSSQKTVIPKPPSIKPGPITYLGAVKSGISDKLIGLVQLKGQTYRLSKGDSLESWKVKNIHLEYMTLQKKGESWQINQQ